MVPPVKPAWRLVMAISTRRSVMATAPNHPLISDHVDGTFFLLHESLTEDSNDPRLTAAWQWKMQGYADLVQYLRECYADHEPTRLLAVP